MYNDYELVFLAQEKDEIASEMLYSKYEDFINNKAKKNYYILKKYGLELEDIKQEVIIGFEKAINDFDQDNEACFFTFANMCVDRHLHTIMKKYTGYRNKILNDAFCIDEDDEYSLLDIVGDNNTPEYCLFEKDDADNLFNKIDNELTFSESIVFKLKLDGYDYKEISDVLDVKIKSVYNYIRKIKLKVKRICNI